MAVANWIKTTSNTNQWQKNAVAKTQYEQTVKNKSDWFSSTSSEPTNWLADSKQKDAWQNNASPVLTVWGVLQAPQKMNIAIIEKNKAPWSNIHNDLLPKIEWAARSKTSSLWGVSYGVRRQWLFDQAGITFDTIGVAFDMIDNANFLNPLLPTEWSIANV